MIISGAVGWTYFAGLYCNACMANDFADELAADQLLIDAEGNEACAVYGWDELGDGSHHCMGTHCDAVIR
jgi:hypothetical protein